MAKRRKFALPYNGTNPQWFVDKTVGYSTNIDHVFCELPFEEMLSHTRYQFNGVNAENLNFCADNQKRYEYMTNCIHFLRLSEGKFKRICPVNAAYYKFANEADMINFAVRICQVVCDFKVDGLIITDYRLGLLLRQLMPDLELHTSCNSYQWMTKQMEIWKDKVGITLFNPPREILRFPSKLKEMHDAGFKLKCIINESCLVGCPNSSNHQMSVAMKCYFGGNCIQNGIGDIFKANWVLPRWLKYYDKYVDVYKIAGRNSEGEYPFRVLDVYLQERDDIVLTDIMTSGTAGAAKILLPPEVLKNITFDKVPDKLMYCECNHCNICGLCEKTLKSLIPSNYYPSFEKQKEQQKLVIRNLEEFRKEGFKGVGVVSR